MGSLIVAPIAVTALTVLFGTIVYSWTVQSTRGRPFTLTTAPIGLVLTDLGTASLWMIATAPDPRSVAFALVLIAAVLVQFRLGRLGIAICTAAFAIALVAQQLVLLALDMPIELQPVFRQGTVVGLVLLVVGVVATAYRDEQERATRALRRAELLEEAAAEIAAETGAESVLASIPRDAERPSRKRIPHRRRRRDRRTGHRRARARHDRHRRAGGRRAGDGDDRRLPQPDGCAEGRARPGPPQRDRGPGPRPGRDRRGAQRRSLHRAAVRSRRARHARGIRRPRRDRAGERPAARAGPAPGAARARARVLHDRRGHRAARRGSGARVQRGVRRRRRTQRGRRSAGRGRARRGGAPPGLGRRALRAAARPRGGGSLTRHGPRLRDGVRGARGRAGRTAGGSARGVGGTRRGERRRRRGVRRRYDRSAPSLQRGRPPGTHRPRRSGGHGASRGGRTP